MNTELKIPENAMPVVEILRRDVPKPTARIVGVDDVFTVKPRFECGKCPLGLHPTAMSKTPVGGCFEAGPLLTMWVWPFYRWWDGLTLEEARLAVDLIWPTEGTEEKS